MSDIKCPFCQQELEDAEIHSAGLYFCCPNCYNKQKEKDDNYTATPKIWQELIRTRKALDVAVDALKSAHDYYEYCIQRDKDCDSDDINWDCTAMNMDNDIFEALEQITALEQKDVK